MTYVLSCFLRWPIDGCWQIRLDGSLPSILNERKHYWGVKRMPIERHTLRLASEPSFLYPKVNIGHIQKKGKEENVHFHQTGSSIQICLSHEVGHDLDVSSVVPWLRGKKEARYRYVKQSLKLIVQPAMQSTKSVSTRGGKPCGDVCNDLCRP